MDAYGQPPQARSSGTAESTVVMATLGLVAGLLIGASGPLFVLIVSPAFVAGPTWGGLALLLAAGLTLVLGPVALLPWGRRWTVPLLAGCLCLAAGTFVGSALGRSYGTGGWARVAPTPTLPPRSFPPPPVVLVAPGTVTVRLEDAPGFTPAKPGAVDGGLFGHWCHSQADSKSVGRVEVIDIGSLRGRELGLFVALPSGRTGTARVGIQVMGGIDGAVPYWSGEARATASGATRGRVSFEALAASPVVDGWPTELSGEIAWQCGAWHRA